MARYVWQCENCEQKIEIQRKMSESEDPPTTEELDCCSERDLKKRPTSCNVEINGYSYSNGYSDNN